MAALPAGSGAGEVDVEQQGAGLAFRRATRADLARIVAMLADDAIGATRDEFREPLPQSYVDAFGEIDADPGQLLIVAESGGRMVQLTTDKRRADAHRFYESLGFVASHEGMKLRLGDGS